MSDWTKTPEEYEQVRKLMNQVPFGNATVQLKNGKQLKGVIVGQSSGTDAGIKFASTGRPLVSSMWGEFRLRLENGSIVVITAREIERIDCNSAG
jgi:hypothetical protein